MPAHAGTLDVDIVIDLQLLGDTDAYHSLEDNLKRMGFERAVNEQGLKLSWRWQTRTEHGALMVLELVADAPQIAGGRVQPLPMEGTISALNIPHSSIVFDLHQVTEIRAELLGENGMATERVKHADIVSFTCLKTFAFDQRFERKDAHDLVYCIEHAPDGLGAVVAAFGHALAGTHSAVIRKGLNVLRRRFANLCHAGPLRIVADRRCRLEVVEQPRQLRGLVHRVQRHRNGGQLPGRQRGDQEVRGVLQNDGHLIAAAQASGLPPEGQSGLSESSCA